MKVSIHANIRLKLGLCAKRFIYGNFCFSKENSSGCIELFAEKGCTAVRVSELAGVARGTIYNNGLNLHSLFIV